MNTDGCNPLVSPSPPRSLLFACFFIWGNVCDRKDFYLNTFLL